MRNGHKYITKKPARCLTSVGKVGPAIVGELVYKDLDFDWAINTLYLCGKQGNCYKCDTCFNIIKNCASIADFVEIFNKLDNYRTWKWREIEQRNHTSNGFMQIKELHVHKMLEKHFASLKIDDDVVYKIEIKGRHRVWGIRHGSVFYLIWNDEEHRFYKHRDTNYTNPKKSSGRNLR
jgi:hypothetical protein